MGGTFKTGKSLQDYIKWRQVFRATDALRGVPQPYPSAVFAGYGINVH